MTWLKYGIFIFQTEDLHKLYEVKGHKSEIDDIDINPAGSKVNGTFFIINELEHDKTNKMNCVPSKDSGLGTI